MIGCAEKVPENYSNVAMFFEKTQVEKICPKYVNDCKMNNILSGLQTNSCKFPCVFGECYRSYRDRETGKWIKGSPRSVKSLKEIQAKWKEETESDRKKLKFYKNVEFGPIFF